MAAWPDASETKKQKEDEGADKPEFGGTHDLLPKKAERERSVPSRASETKHESKHDPQQPASLRLRRALNHPSLRGLTVAVRAIKKHTDPQKAKQVFLDSVAEGDHEQVQRIIDTDKHIASQLAHIRNKERRTSLHLAALQGHAHVVQILLQGCREHCSASSSPPPDRRKGRPKRKPRKVSPAAEAEPARQTPLSKLLHARDNYGNTALLLVCKLKEGHLLQTNAIIKLLLQEGAASTIGRRSSRKRRGCFAPKNAAAPKKRRGKDTCLHWLCHHGLCDDLELVVNAIRDVPNGFQILNSRNRRGFTAMDVASRSYKRSVEYAALTPFPEHRREIRYARQMKVILQEGLDQYSEEASANSDFLQGGLFNAAFAGYTEIVVKILEIASKAWEMGNTTSKGKRTKRRKFLLASPIRAYKKTDHNSTPVHAAAQMGHEELIPIFKAFVIEHLGYQAFNINARDSGGNTPLHYAVQMSCARSVEYGATTKTVISLISSGADPFIGNNRFFSSIKYAQQPVLGFMLASVRKRRDTTDEYGVRPQRRRRLKNRRASKMELALRQAVSHEAAAIPTGPSMVMVEQAPSARDRMVSRAHSASMVLPEELPPRKSAKTRADPLGKKGSKDGQKSLSSLSSRRSATRSKTEYVIVLDIRVKFLAKKLEARLQETGMHVFALPLPKVFPDLLFLLISADTATIDKAAQSLGMMQKLVHTNDRLPFAEDKRSLFEPFRSKDRQEVIRHLIYSKLKLCHYLEVGLLQACYPLHSLAHSRMIFDTLNRYDGFSSLLRVWYHQLKPMFCRSRRPGGGGKKRGGRKGSKHASRTRGQSNSSIHASANKKKQRAEAVQFDYEDARRRARVLRTEYLAESRGNGFQMVNVIAGYFGEKRALWFHLVFFLSTALQYVILPGLIVWCFELAFFVHYFFVLERSFTESFNECVGGDSLNQVLFLSFFTIVWSESTAISYVRKEAEVLSMWDMYKRRNLASATRDQFLGDEVPARFDRSLHKKSPARLNCTGLPFALLFVVAVLIVSLAVLLYERSLGPWLLPQEAYWLGWQGGIVNGFSMQVLGIAYNKVAKWLNDMENHRTERIYEGALLQKVFLFQFLNQFSTIFMVQMFLRSNMEQLSGLLVSTLITKQLTELFVDFLCPVLAKGCRRRVAMQLFLHRHDEADGSAGEGTGQQPSSKGAKGKWGVIRKRTSELRFVSNHQMLTVVENQVLVDEDVIYQVHRYVQVVLEFGIVAMYSPVVPLVAVLVLVHNLWMFRMEIKLLTQVHRRPRAKVVNGHSPWGSLMTAMVLVATFINVINVLMTSRLINSVILQLVDSLDTSDAAATTPASLNTTTTTAAAAATKDLLADASVAVTAASTAITSAWNSTTLIPDLTLDPCPDAGDLSEPTFWDRLVGQRCSYDFFEPATLQMVLGMMLQHMFIAIVASGHFCILRRPKWLYLVQKKKDYWNKFYHELAAKKASSSVTDQREAAGHVYNPKPLHTSTVRLRPELKRLARKIAVNSHREWAREKMDLGFTYGPFADSADRKSPFLKPFHLLSEKMQELNLSMAREPLLAILVSDFDFAPIQECADGLDEITVRHVTEHRLDSTLTVSAPEQPPDELSASVQEASAIAAFDPVAADVSEINVPGSVVDLVERLAEHAHESWAAERMDSGWSYGEEQDDCDKHHPLLVPYGFLKEDDRAAERDAVIKVIKMVIYCGFNVLTYEQSQERRENLTRAKKKELDAAKEKNELLFLTHNSDVLSEAVAAFTAEDKEGQYSCPNEREPEPASMISPVPETEPTADGESEPALEQKK